MFAEVKTLRLIGVAFLILTAIIFFPEPEGFPISLIKSWNSHKNSSCF